ncbi:MAG TPA: CAP domain-containing protein [Patescibacteria group bacterium]|nr:CAP domain-containing protein [Patescibacteria group bacterium]
MKLIQFFRHLFVPHESNNQKAKLLHSSSLTVLAALLISFQILLSYGAKALPKVLGYAANISPTEVIRLTNEKRAQNGLGPLTQNSTLSSAAVAKGNDMLAKGYWAHFAPDGTSPWSFFVSFGYKYKYAGENLARDFSSASATVDAWMNSPTHRENMLNPKYNDVGIGVVEGSLAGADTTVVVQFFGTLSSSAPAIPVAQAKDVAATTKPSPKVIAVQTTKPVATPVPTATPTPLATNSPTPNAVANINNSRISPFESTKNLSLGVVGVLLLVLSLDLIIVRRKRIARIGGRTIAHLAFFGMILAVVLILKAGQII